MRKKLKKYCFNCVIHDVMDIIPNMNQNKVFIFCLYRKNYPHQAYILPMHESNKKISELLTLIGNTNLPIIQNIFEKHDQLPNTYKCTGYKINGEINSLENTFNVLNYWENMDNSFGNNNNDQFMYYVHDDNHYLSPCDLYFKLLSMTSYADKKFTVDRCVILSDVPFNYKPPVMIRFFVNKEITCVNVKNILMKYEKILSVKPASKDGINIVGFGYIELKSIDDKKEIVGKKMIDEDGLIIVFDNI